MSSYQYLQIQCSSKGFLLVLPFSLFVTAFSDREKPDSLHPSFPACNETPISAVTISPHTDCLLTPHITMWMNLTNITLSKRSQIQKNINCLIPFKWKPRIGHNNQWWYKSWQCYFQGGDADWEGAWGMIELFHVSIQVVITRVHTYIKIHWTVHLWLGHLMYFNMYVRHHKNIFIKACFLLGLFSDFIPKSLHWRLCNIQNFNNSRIILRKCSSNLCWSESQSYGSS